MYLSSQLKKKKTVCVTLELVLWCWNTRMERAREIGRLSLRSSFCGWWFEGPLSSICVICNLFGCERDPGQRSRPASEILTCPLTEMDTLSSWHLSESSSAFKAEWCAHQKHFPCYVGAEVLNQLGCFRCSFFRMVLVYDYGGSFIPAVETIDHLPPTRTEISMCCLQKSLQTGSRCIHMVQHRTRGLLSRVFRRDSEQTPRRP